MRGKYQTIYDNFYYRFERGIYRIMRNIRMTRKYLRYNPGPEFQEAYKNTILPYWKQFGIKPKKHWAMYYYKMTGTLDPRYIPDDIHYYYIIPHFDNMVYVRPLEDKNLYSLLFHDIKRPETIFKYVDGQYYTDNFALLSKAEALSLCSTGEFIVKPTTDTGQGSGIRFFSGMPAEDVDTLLSSYKDVDYIVQKVLAQHPSLARFNPTSLNTVRVVSFFFKGEVHILSAILRIGPEGSRVDNISKGGYQAVIQPDGSLKKLAYTHLNGTHAHVPQTASGIPFENFVIPSWEKLVETVKTAALRLPHLKIIGWDIAIDENSEINLVEFNCLFGPNQENCGPTFGDMTDEVLSEVFAKKKPKR